MSYSLTFLGTGSAFATEGVYHSNMLLVTPKNKKLLIDCGSDIRFALRDAGLSYQDIDQVYISHLHADHIGGLEGLALTSYFNPKKHKPTLYINEKLAKILWETSLAGGLRTLRDINVNLETYFNLEAIDKEFTWEGIKFDLISAMHIYDNKKEAPCFGLFFNINDKNIYITADTQYTPDRLMPIYEKADIIFHDCETGQFPSGVHAAFDDLINLPKHIKEKMWLYHYNASDVPSAKETKEKGFLGFVKQGQTFKF
ncbi:MAG: ribonuclease Z [Gammaproteobacteria bacterium]|nr:ribonuclease Z [Gammaproteobacteria bacterium]